MPPIPPWLNPPDIAGEYVRGLQLGAQIGEAQNRLQAEQERTQMELQARQKQAESAQAMDQARLATTAAMRQEQLGIEKQRLNEVAQVNAAKTRDAAVKAAAQHRFASALAGGMPVEQALYQSPELVTPTAVGVARRADVDATGQRLTMREQGLKLQAERLTMQEQAQKDREARGQKIGTMDIPLSRSNPNDWTQPTMKGVPLDSPIINQVMGTNAPPGTGTNFPKQAAGPGAPFKEGAFVRSKKDKKLYQVVNGEPVLVEE